MQEAKRCKEASLIREYIDSVVESESLPMSADEKIEWRTWAIQKADWYDPQINSLDALLKEVDKNRLADYDVV